MFRSESAVFSVVAEDNKYTPSLAAWVKAEKRDRDSATDSLPELQPLHGRGGASLSILRVRLPVQAASDSG